MELKGGFETSNANQLEIRNLCEDLGKKIDELAGRMSVLEVEVGDLKITVEENKERSQSLKVREEEVMAKLESMENSQRRNNLRFPKGLEGDDLKGLVVRLIKTEVLPEELDVDIARDIQEYTGSRQKCPLTGINPGRFWS
ncbi:hypothetical protein NDU88_001787 [Pleurodeles waltl]|uniref:Uncharacterized protein n=1 Tax=Pleurodeles waltl TaxID=8319 RepID=A0AAV7MVM1_PLEWA|nr:hypothetical protein NDU88_001787 [Pleurodeles waltl]